MSYPVSGGAHDLDFAPPEGYPQYSMVPHGMSVVLHAPAVFEWTASADPARHISCATTMGASTSKNYDPNDAGKILRDQITPLMAALEIPNGLKAVGYTEADIPALVEGTLPQHRVTKLSPKPVGREELTHLFENSMTLY